MIPVATGGVLALLGVFGGGFLSHLLKTRTDKANREAKKFEEFLTALFDHKHWLAQMNSHRSFGAKEPDAISKLAKIRAITSLYFRQFKAEVTALDLAADHYEIAMYDAAEERLKSGTALEEKIAASKEAYKPYAQAFFKLVNVLELHAKTIVR